MRFILVLFMGSALVSCDTKVDPIQANNNTPVFTISSELNNWSKESEYTSELIDSVKIGLPFNISYKWEDEYFVHFSTNEQKGILEHLNKDSLWRDSLSLVENNGVFKYTPTVVGVENFQFYITDPYESQTYANVTLQIFDNLPPFAQFVVENRDLNAPNEYTIDCTDSYDKDKHFNGEILEYRLTINGAISISTTPLFIRVFQSGTYVVSLEVKDNNGQWSAPNEISLTI